MLVKENTYSVSKPSLARVAVSPVNADRHGQSKDQSKNVNLRRLCPLDKSKVSGIIKVTKDASTSGCPRLVHKIKKNFLKPSLARVAVSPVNADRNSQSKDMESQSDRHRSTSFTEDSGEKTARRCFGALGVQKEP